MHSALEKPRITRNGLLLIAAIWLIYSVFYTLLILTTGSGNFLHIVSGILIYSFFFFLYSLPAWILVIRQMDESPWRWRLAAHAVLGVLYAWAVYETNLPIYKSLFGLNSPGTIQLIVNKNWVIYGNFIFYAIQFAIYHGIRNFQRLRAKEQEAAQLLALSKERELAALKAQINPHFLFNTLNGISAMVTRDPEEARRMIARLAELLRFSFESFNHQRIPLRDELRFVKSYLEIEKRRFGERLEVQYDIARETLAEEVPPMLLQPLVENAVIHGIAPKEEGGRLAIRIFAEFRKLSFEIRDTGCGFNGTSAEALLKNGIGLKNTDTRLRKIYGESAGLRFSKVEPSGFSVGFSIPI